MAQSMLPLHVYALEDENPTQKTETVYAVLNADGSISDTIVSSWLHDDDGIHNIKETLDETDVENVKTDEEPEVDGNVYTWNSKHNDIYYQGKTTKQLPIEVKITYELDGHQLSAKEVAGQTKLQHFYSGTIVTTKGIISFSDGYKKFTAMDTNIITKEVGNGWDGENLNPAYITVSTNPNISWQYYDVVSNEVVADIHSSKMQTEGGIDFNQPFVANGGNASVYKITKNGEQVSVVVTFNGQELFREVF